MEALVILSKREQEYLLRIIEGALQVRDARSFFLWTQGQIQALLPHQVMVGLQFGAGATLQHIECSHAAVKDDAALARLCDPESGLAVRLAMQGLREPLPCMADASSADGPLAPFQAALQAEGYDNLMLHGSGALPGGSTMFLLLGMPIKPGPRSAYFLALLLPYLHMALQRLASEPQAVAIGLRPLSARETEILGWVREGKSNYEVGCILGISALTVKNHLQRVYKTLGVSNRAHALSRCMALRLLEPARRAH